MDELWDVKKVARLLGVTERTIYSKLKSGDLPAIRIGGRWRFRPDDIGVWLDARRTGVSTAAESPSQFGELPRREQLEALLADVDDPVERRLAFAGLLARACRVRGWREPVIVGGHAVEFYTAGGYTTVDIDLVVASDALSQVLEGWGFARDGRHWYDERLGLLVEAPGHQLDSEQQERVVAVEVRGETVSVLGVEDLIVDRLNACVHWDSREACEWARTLIDAYRDRIEWDYLRQRALSEHVEEALARAEGERP